MGPFVSNYTQPNFHCCPLETKRKKKGLRNTFHMNFPRARLQSVHNYTCLRPGALPSIKDLPQNVFPVIPRGYHAKKKGKESRAGLGFQKIHTHTHTPNKMGISVFWNKQPQNSGGKITLGYMPSNYTNRLEQGLLVFRSTYFAIGTSGFFTDEISPVCHL